MILGPERIKTNLSEIAIGHLETQGEGGWNASFLGSLVLNDLAAHILEVVWIIPGLTWIGLISFICQVISAYLSFELYFLLSHSSAVMFIKMGNR